MATETHSLDGIFCAAVEMASADDRAAYIARACGDDGELRARVEMLVDAHFRAGSFLERPAEALRGTEPFTPAPGEEIPTAPAEGPDIVIGPYKLLQPIGEGGMGAVFMAEQSQPVQRQVALKLIKPGMDSRQVVARFEAERQALALMDHPNIAKVFDGGATEAGRPYFVMELVKGVPITTYCDEHKLTPRQRLELFAPVCQAVQHAHQKGIIHRDLKPSNVLVALYDGKPVPKVIDFGIAKATGAKLTERTLSTEFGSVVGTLEYMSPEQAQLNQLDVDTRSDVYSLGVVLYELLTGTTPLERRRLQETGLVELLRIIREEEPPRPSARLSTTAELPAIAASRGLEPKKLSGVVRGELDWIVMKALEKDRDRRYDSANGFAADVGRYLKDEPVLACPPSAWYRVRKFARRRRAGLLTAAAALLVVLAAASGVGWVLWDRAAQEATRRQELAGRLAETDRTVSVALARAEQWAGQAEGRRTTTSQEAAAALGVWGQADGALAEAEAALRTGAADEPMRQRIADVRRRLEEGRRQTEQRRAQALRQETLLRDLDEARLAGATLVEDTFDYAGAAAKYRAAFAAYGLEVKPSGTADLARQIRAEEPAVRDALLVALDDWAIAASHERMGPSKAELRALAAAADDDAWRERRRAATAARDRATLRDLSVEARQSFLPPSSLVLLAVSLDDVGERDEAVVLLRWARGQHPTDFWLHYDLGSLLAEDQGRTPVDLEEAIGCFRAALALRPDEAAVHSDLGIALYYKKQLDEAIAEDRKAIDRDPKSAFTHNNLGNALRLKGQLDEAVAEFREAIRLKKDDAFAHNNLGNALADKGRLDEAIAEYREALRIDKDFAGAHDNLGHALRLMGQLDEAIAEFREAIRLKKDDAEAHNNLGNALRDKGQLDEAIAEDRKAVDLDPKNALAHNNLGNALRDKGRLDEAIAEFREVVQIDKDIAYPHNNLGIALRDDGRLDEAIAEFREAIRLKKDLPEAHCNLGNALSDNGQWDEAITEHRKSLQIQPDFAQAHNGLGNALYHKGQLDEAVAELREAIRINKDFAEAHYNLGAVLLDKGRLDEAVAEFREAIRLKKDYAEAHNNLAGALRDEGRLDEAVAECREVVRIKKDDAEAHYNLGNVLRDDGRLDEAVAEFREAVRLNKDYAEAHCNLAGALKQNGEFRQALEEYRCGDQLGSKDPKWPYPSAKWVRQCERLVELDGQLPGFLEGTTTPASADEGIELARLCTLKRLHRAAARFYEEAFAAQPQLAEDPNTAMRYNAACAAALAGCGEGKDADKLEDKERARLRRQALDWLRADLEARGRLLDKAPDKARSAARVAKVLQYLLAEPSFAGVRGPEALAKLPETERQPWQQLWDDVADALVQARGKATPEKKPDAK